MAETIDLSGRVALVSGGSKNIGKAVAGKLANAGACVGITWQQNQKQAEETCEEFRAQGLTMVPFQMEVTEKASVDRSIAQVVEQLGPIDILVNSAAIRPPLTLQEITPEWWDRIMNINARGPFFLSQAVIPSMMDRGFGRILFIGGIAAFIGSQNTARDASKTACIGIMRSLSLLGTPHGVTCNMVHPGFVDTRHDNLELYGPDTRRLERLGKLRIGHMSEPQDAANMVLFLASPMAGYISGQEIFVTGGMPPHLGI
jgi:3-oxoacyl-[acyl-carrier protein] reductase